MVVAHPDDETIFGGAQLLTEPTPISPHESPSDHLTQKANS